MKRTSTAMNEDQNEKLALIIGVNNRAFACTRVAWTLDRNYSIGEYNIYQLPDFSEHDGIILDVNSTHQREQYGFY